MSLWWYLVAIPLGGFGAVARVYATQTGEHRVPGGAPAMTAAINVVGAAGIGVVVGATGDIGVLVLGSGLLGGFTTFSTWMVEVDAFNRSDRVREAVLTLIIPAVLGAAAYALTRAVF
ncbi:MAG: CrcB family protein [Gaiellales bacterium]